MTYIKTLLALVLMGVCVLPAEAGPTSDLVKTRLARSKAVVPGRWHADLAKCQAYAKANGVPLIAVWSNGDLCGHCITFEQAVMKSDFTKWMKTSGMVFCFVHSGDGSYGAQNGTPYNFCWGPSKALNSFPFVRVWWYTNNGKTKKVDVAATGDTIDGGLGNATGAKKAVAWFKAKLKGFTPPSAVPKYTGGLFDFGDSEADRLEVEAGAQTTLTVYLARTNSLAVARASTNRLVVAWPDATVVTNTVNWSAGEDEAKFAFDVGALTNVGETVRLTLLDAAGSVKDARTVPVVAPVENAPANPLWLGERTTDELAWGEWTMDIDVATNKVAAYNRAHPGGARAYTLLLLEGALWCPDCVKTDEYLFMHEKFRKWAQAHRVALVAVDVAFGDATAKAGSLLTHVPVNRSKTSGCAYLARKGIDRAAGLETLARNFEIAQALRLPNWTNPTRPPVPSLFVVRDGGRLEIASRLQYFGGVAAPQNADAIDAHLMRLDEMLAQVDESGEELNDTVFRTTQVIGKRAAARMTVSAVDGCDVFRLLPEETFNKRITFSLEGAADATFELKVVHVDGGTATTVAERAGTLAEGLALVTPVASSNCYVTVGYKMVEVGEGKFAAADACFSMTNAASSLCPYTLKTDFVVEPREVADEVRVEDGARTITMALASNSLYRITGLAQVPPQLEPAAEGAVDNLYRALATEDVELSLATTVCTNQLWRPGAVGFATTSASASESAGTYLLRVVRTGGVSGRATAQIAFNAAKSSRLDHLVTLPAFEELVWEEGDDTERTVAITVLDNPFADGDQTLYFDVTPGGVAAAGVVQFRLSLRDNDRKVPGRLAITGTRPSEMAKAMTTFVRAGDVLTIAVGRLDGADGALAATLAASAGTLNTAAFTWPGRDTADREAVLSGLETAGRTVKVTLTPAKGTAVDAARRILSVSVLGADVPGFQEARRTVPATRYVALKPQPIPLDDRAVATTKIKKYSGRLPPGVAWRQDGRDLVLSGVPTAAGAYTAVFRAATGSAAGLTVTVEMDVVDPVVAGAADGTALNASVASSRTFADVPVLDDEAGRLAGVLTLTLPRTGRASAKYRALGQGAVSLASRSWTACDPATGALETTLVGVAGTNRYALAVRVAADGAVTAALADPLRPAGVTCKVPANIWTAANPASDFSGVYTVDLEPIRCDGPAFATGDGSLMLKMNTTAACRSGAFSYAGRLPNGMAVSGSARLTPADWVVAHGFWARGLLPVVQTGARDELAALLQFTPGAADPAAASYETVDGAPSTATGRCYFKRIRRVVRRADEGGAFWRHVGKTDLSSYAVDFDVHGAYYDASESLVETSAATFGTSALTFFVADGKGKADSLNDLDAAVMENLRTGPVDASLWATNPAAAGVKVAYNAKTKTSSLAVANAKGTKLTSFAFAAATGRVSGSFTLDGVKMTFAGVAMPGWGNGDCGDCGVGGGMGGVEAKMRPFVTGTAWFNDTFSYEDAAGRERTESVRRSCAISIGVNAGE